MKLENKYNFLFKDIKSKIIFRSTFYCTNWCFK